MLILSMQNPWAQKQTGFTIVELLIVIVVIAILAAITIVAYNGIQNRANDSAVRADMRNMATKINEYELTDSPTGAPPAATAAALSPLMKFSKSSYQGRGNTSLLYCRTDTEFALIAQSKSGNVFVMKDGATMQPDGAWGGSNSQNACVWNDVTNVKFPNDSGTSWFEIYTNNTWAF